jgi:hypothetical protein
MGSAGDIDDAYVVNASCAKLAIPLPRDKALAAYYYR